VKLDFDGVGGWYDDRARPFLQEHASERVAALDEQRRRLGEIARARTDDVAVCFLGNAGVGKSTLLNALVDERHNVLPHGGVGALTAQATVVRYAERPFLRAHYFDPKTLRGILLTLERAHALALGRNEAASEDLASGLDAEDLQEAEIVVPSGESDGGEVGERLESYQRQLRLMVQGDQRGSIDLPYLLDAMRAVLGLQPKWERSVAAEDASRVARLRVCLQATAQPVSDRAHREVFASEGDMPSFVAELRDHASGFLAPIIKSLEVGWSSPALADGLVLVDLPGIGVAKDEYRRVTTHWIREKAHAIVLVVDRAGVMESAADLLRKTGFLAKLLHDGDDPTVEPVTLATVMVKIDLTADAAWQDELNEKGPDAGNWDEHFRDACERARTMMREQMRQELASIVKEGPEATRSAREATIHRLLETLQVHPVSAPQFRKFHLAHPKMPALISRPEDSGIPQLSEALSSLARQHRTRVEAQRASALKDFLAYVRSSVMLVQAQWQEDTRAEREAEQLREELDAFLAPRQRELEVRNGAFREFLRNSLPEQIEARVGEASLIAQAEISKYLNRLGKMPWNTLCATVSHGGAFIRGSGEHVNLPNELALRFEEPIAVVWSRYILGALRKRTSELGADYVAMVGEVVEWARAQDARVQPRFVEALHENLLAETKGLATVGKEAVDELKKKVRGELDQRLEKKIRERCEAFVRQRKNEGIGVKNRILEMFREELAEGITDVAQPVAVTVLKNNYNEVQREISDHLAGYTNPLERSRDALVQSHEDSVRRSDRAKRGRVLAQAEAILAAIPEA
jgi:GTP-binding protein EngB required for normal cell division/gas vesicle protein